MTGNKLFYYPYAALTNEQLPLLKVAALYFDRFVVLDPVEASWDTVGADHVARDAVRLLRDAGILEVVTPADVLATYEKQIVDAIRYDLADGEFRGVCDAHSRATGKDRWTLSLAKVPQDLQTDRAMRDLMGDFARAEARRLAGPIADRDEYQNYDETEVGAIIDQHARLARRAPEIPVYDEWRDGYEGTPIEYRYADVPLALGEAIMVNHALYGGLLHAGATPITDDPFHSGVLGLKLNRVTRGPVVQEARAQRARQFKLDMLTTSALMDSQLNLPVLNPALPLSTVLEYRHEHDADLCRARDKLGWMARRIEGESWTREFAEELEHKTVPDLAYELDEARKLRDSWTKTKRGRLVLAATGIAAGGAAAVLSIIAAPLAPVALATAGLGLVSGTAIPGAEWLPDWRDGKQGVRENGLHYLLMT